MLREISHGSINIRSEKHPKRDLFKESIFLFRDDERVQRKCESGTTHTRRDMEDP